MEERESARTVDRQLDGKLHFPHIGSLDVADIRLNDVVKVLKSVWIDKHATARKKSTKLLAAFLSMPWPRSGETKTS